MNREQYNTFGKPRTVQYNDNSPSQPFASSAYRLGHQLGLGLFQLGLGLFQLGLGLYQLGLHLALYQDVHCFRVI
jgi:hypothetical protein